MTDYIWLLAAAQSSGDYALSTLSAAGRALCAARRDADVGVAAEEES